MLSLNLDPKWRHQGDRLADEAVAALHARGLRGDPLVNVRGLARDDEACARFVDATRELPPWYDARALRAGRRMATRQAPLTFMVLLAGSLIESFAIADGAAVLVKTGRLDRDTIRRIYETATLVRALLFDDSELPHHDGHEALLRVRLLHAFVRRWVTASGFDVAKRGVPVNQMDMLHTLLVFSHVVTRGIAALGARVSAEERESWCALWRLAGHVLGVKDEVSFSSHEDELARYRLVRAHYAPDDGSRALAHAVLGALAGEPPFFLPKMALDQVARASLDDDALADAFALARGTSWLRAVQVASRASAPFISRAPRASYAMGRAFIEVNRWRVLRTMKPTDYGFRTA